MNGKSLDPHEQQNLDQGSGSKDDLPDLQPTVVQHSVPGSTITEASQLPSEWSLGPFPSMPGSSDTLANKADELSPGSVLFDFQIHRLLGKGAFGQVYLALQLSLNRFIALKVAADLGAEGRTMAQLEHPNIVQVYSEQIVKETNTRLLCMQFVAGPTLRTALNKMLEAKSGQLWTGRDLMDMVTSFSNGPATVQVSELKQHTDLSAMGATEVICWLTCQIAEGLAYAHDRSIVHRDIKPANILLNSIGTPLLADFNLSEHVSDAERSKATGGTLAYMAPEQLRAFAAPGSEQENVGAAADVYSLALVLVELLTGRTPIPNSDDSSGSTPREIASSLVDYRSSAYEFQTEDTSPTDRILPAVIRRATAPDPQSRTSSARVFASELTACQKMANIENNIFSGGRLSDLARRYPVTTFGILATVPHFIASVVNVSYNALRVPDLPVNSIVDPARTGGMQPIVAAFQNTTSWYNFIVWPLCMLFVISMLKKSVRAIRMQPCENAIKERDQRTTLLELPGRLRMIAMLGWLPGVIVFPLTLVLQADASFVPVTAHFVCNLGLSFLIALTFSYLGIIWMIVSVLYPRHWDYPEEFKEQTVRSELAEFTAALSRCRAAAGVVPLMGALLVVVVSPESSTQYLGFRLLLASLIILGIAGQHIATQTVTSIQNRIELYCS